MSTGLLCLLSWFSLRKWICTHVCRRCCRHRCLPFVCTFACVLTASHAASPAPCPSDAPGQLPRRYSGASNTTDDIGIISRRASLMPDDVGDTPANATRLQPPASFVGVIGFRGDSDVFSFSANKSSKRAVKLSLVEPFVAGAADAPEVQPRSNLDAELALMNSSGHVITRWTNDGGLLFGVFQNDNLPYQVCSFPRGLNPCEAGTNSYGWRAQRSARPTEVVLTAMQL